MLEIRKLALLCSAAALYLAPGAPAAENRGREALQAIADAYFARRFAEPPPVGLPYETALATQKQYVEILGSSLGKRAGYKVGLVTAAGQKRFNISHPVRGVLF